MSITTYKKRAGILALSLAFVLTALLPVFVINAQSSNPVKYDNWTSGNAAKQCEQIGTYKYAYKIEEEELKDGSKDYDTKQNNTITIETSKDEGEYKTFDWSSTAPVGAVAVKADTGANVWMYSPQVMSDTSLYAYENKGISNITFCWNDKVEEPEEVTVTLEKRWFNEEGSQVDMPDGLVEWSVEMYAQTEGEPTIASLPSGSPSYDFDEGDRYGVRETAPEGWEAVACSSVGVTSGYFNVDTSSISVQEGAPDGTFLADGDGGIHVVCNQEIADDVYFFQFDKEWVGDVDEVDLDALEVTFVADNDFAWILGTNEPVEVTPGVTTLTNVREVVTGLPEQCTATADVLPLTELTAPKDNDDEPYGEDNTFTLTVTNTIECEDGDVLGDEDEKEDEGEILAATTVRSLPETGSSAGIVASIAAVIATSLAMASTVARSAFARFTA